MPSKTLSDEQLVAEVKYLAAVEQQATAALIRSLAEFDARRLGLAQGCSSLFTYCTQVLHLAEGAAYTRIEAARAARRFPLVLELLDSGDLTVTTVRLLAPHLTAENHHDVLASARHKRKRDVERLIATLNPLPETPALIRKLPVRATGTSEATTPTALLHREASTTDRPRMEAMATPVQPAPPISRESRGARPLDRGTFRPRFAVR